MLLFQLQCALRLVEEEIFAGLRSNTAVLDNIAIIEAVATGFVPDHNLNQPADVPVDPANQVFVDVVSGEDTPKGAPLDG